MSQTRSSSWKSKSKLKTNIAYFNIYIKIDDQIQTTNFDNIDRFLMQRNNIWFHSKNYHMIILLILMNQLMYRYEC